MLSTVLLDASSMSNPMVIVLVIVMFILLLAIGLLANVVLSAATYYRDKEKETEAAGKKEKDNTAAITAVAVAGLILFAFPVFAQDSKTVPGTPVPSPIIQGLSDTAFYFMAGVIVVELLVLFILLYQLRVFLGKEKPVVLSEAGETTNALKWQRLWNRLNRFRPAEQEADLDLGHDYDGIRELDNRLPPWWLYGFYITIVIGVVYLWRYHVSHTAPLSAEEYQIAMQEAEVQKAAYLQHAANSVDENSVTLITDAIAIDQGKTVFLQNCSPCHGKSGEGIVGPNLTDDYWLHGGSVKDIFKTIKYGWPEKGMKSWKEELAPAQIAQIVGFIKSIHGSNPPNGKEKQGELYHDPEVAVPGIDSSKSPTAGKIIAVNK